MQTPQYYANVASSRVAAASWSQQALFFGPIARGKDAHEAMFCCGTNVVFRRRALEAVGGFPSGSLTEDFAISLELHERGWRSVYVPEVLASGLGPEDLASYVSQQHRWARGCIGMIPRVLRADLPLRRKLQYLLSASYFLSGWTVLVYLSMPVVRILTGAQPVAGAAADSFLAAFGPYFALSLATVASVGAGHYTFAAYSLATSTFWIHVHATYRTLRAAGRQLRRDAQAGRRWAAAAPGGADARRHCRPRRRSRLRLVPGPGRSDVEQRGVRRAARGHSRSRRRRRSCPGSRRRRGAERRATPRRRSSGVRGGWAAVAVGVAALATPTSAGPAEVPSPSEDGRAAALDAAEEFLDRYLQPSGRIARPDDGGDTVSEGQAYGMLLAAALGDEIRLRQIWSWTDEQLQRDDGLLAWRWADGGIVDHEAAADADLLAAAALAVAGARFGDGDLTADAQLINDAVLAHEVVTLGSSPVLVAGPWAESSRTVNASYLATPGDVAALGDARRAALGAGRGMVAERARCVDGDGTAPPARLGERRRRRGQPAGATEPGRRLAARTATRPPG